MSLYYNPGDFAVNETSGGFEVATIFLKRAAICDLVAYLEPAKCSFYIVADNNGVFFVINPTQIAS